MSENENEWLCRGDRGELFNLQHIAFELEPLSGPKGKEILRNIARLIARRMRQAELAKSANSMHTMPSVEPVGGRSI